MNEAVSVEQIAKRYGTHLALADRRTLNSGGILPLAVGIPALLGLLTISLRMHRRRDTGAQPAE